MFKQGWHVIQNFFSGPRGKRALVELTQKWLVGQVMKGLQAHYSSPGSSAFRVGLPSKSPDTWLRGPTRRKAIVRCVDLPRKAVSRGPMQPAQWWWNWLWQCGGCTAFSSRELKICDACGAVSITWVRWFTSCFLILLSHMHLSIGISQTWAFILPGPWLAVSDLAMLPFWALVFSSVRWKCYYLPHRVL